MKYSVLAFYKFIPIENPQKEITSHKKFFKGKEITSRIYISEEGINGQMSASNEAAESYIEWMKEKPEFADLHFKIHSYHEQVFPRQTVKYRKFLVGRDLSVDFNNQGVHLSPKEWRERLEKEKVPLLIDVRNDYETKVGHFEGSTLPKCKNFREFEAYAEKLPKMHDPETTPVMMCCTGGIRCEIYSALLKEKGFKEVYQLQGGIINYGLEEGAAHWKGKLFVFDDRLTVPISENEETDIIGKCHRCNTESETYYNCANMDCNELFLCCPDCLEKEQGCCSIECSKSPKVRPYHLQNPHKPFRRKHLL